MQVSKEDGRKILQNLISAQELRDEEILEKEKPLIDNFSDYNRLDIDENKNAILHYSFKNNYGARISKNGDEWTIVTVRKTSQTAIGDDGPAIELERWLVSGDLETVKQRLEEIRNIGSSVYELYQ